PTTNTPMTTNTWTPYTRYRSSVIPGGNVVRYPNRKRSKIIRNAKAMTGMNEYWMNALNQDQNSQSSFGTIKNGTKSGPTSAQTALAISPKATTAKDTVFAIPTTRSSTQYSRLARIDHASGGRNWPHNSSRCSQTSSKDR